MEIEGLSNFLSTNDVDVLSFRGPLGKKTTVTLTTATIANHHKRAQQENKLSCLLFSPNVDLNFIRPPQSSNKITIVLYFIMFVTGVFVGHAVKDCIIRENIDQY